MPPDYSPSNNRLFFALVPPLDVCERVAEKARELQKTHDLGGRLIKPLRYHITLLFLGDQVSSAGEKAALRAAPDMQSPPFTLYLDKAGSFRNRQMPVWLGPNQPPAELDHLAKLLGKVTGQRTRERQPRFTPHLTTIRNADGLLPATAVDPIEWDVTDYVLIRSVLDQQPVRYEILGRWTLSG